MNYSAIRSALILLIALIFVPASCAEHTGHHDKNKEDHDHASGRKAKEKSVSLSNVVIARLGLKPMRVTRMKVRPGIYRVPTSAVVRVLESREIFLLDVDNKLNRVTCVVLSRNRKHTLIRASGKSLRGRIITSNAALARLAWLNHEEPVAGHGH